jgi:hypothetical protein
MLPDERLRGLLRDADGRAKADPRAMQSIYSQVDAHRLRRSRRPRWVASLLRAAPALAGAAATVVILVGIVQLVPDLAPAATPAAAPTGQPATPATPSEPAGPAPVTDEIMLENLGPLIGPGPWTCAPWATSAGGEDVLSPSGYAGAIAHASCPGPPGATRAQYAFYPTREALQSEYDAIMASEGVAAGGACTDGTPANAPWVLPGDPQAGSLGCFARNGGVQFVWTDQERHILGQWLAPDTAQGLAFWMEWTRSPVAVEAALAGNLAGWTSDPALCTRGADVEFAGAVAVLTCQRPDGENPAFLAQYYLPWMSTWPMGRNEGEGFADARGGPFPDDPMTRAFFSIMRGGGLDVDTTEGCFEGAPGRYMWGYLRPGFTRDTGRVSDPAKASGYVGCYVRSDGAGTTTRLVFTSNTLAVVAVWDAPDFERASAFLQTWMYENYLSLR